MSTTTTSIINTTPPVAVDNLVQTRVYISSRMDLQSRIKNWWAQLRLKAALQHFGLLITLMVYTIAGGLIFQQFEYPAEIARFEHYIQKVTTNREILIQTIVNSTKFSNMDDVISHELSKYENILEESFKAGFPLHPKEYSRKWTTLKAVFFSSTVLTTIGYGNIVPETQKGQAFCILFALVGIPLTLTVIADWGRIFASAVSVIVKHLPPLPARFRNVMSARRTSSYALSAVCYFFVYLAVGSALFVSWEENWTFFDGFYFCFITMTTIGFGDLVPQKPKYMLFATLYILIGLALTSTIIELVRRQYAQSWKQLQALKGPLAENFRKLAVNAPDLDMFALQRDLMKVLTVVTMPKKSSKKIKDKLDSNEDFEETFEAVLRDMISNATEQSKPPLVVEIVFYESSV